MISLSLFAATAMAATFQDYRQPPTPPPPTMPRPQTGNQEETPAPAPTPQLVIPTSPPGRALKDLPGVSVQYYNVTGKNLKGAIKSITEQRPKDASGQPVTASNKWSIKTDLTKRTDSKGACRIISARATLAGTVELPRLADEKSFSKKDLNAWQAYAATLETATAAKLWFVKDHTRDVEQAIVAGTCETAENVSTAAIEQLRARSNQVQAPPATAAAATPPTN